MVTHVVLMKPRPDLTPHDRRALVDAFQRAIREIPTVRAVRVGRRVCHGANYEATSVDAADYAVLIDFEDLAALQAYLAHPAHQELGDRFGRSMTAALVYDFTMGDADALQSLI